MQSYRYIIGDKMKINYIHISELFGEPLCEDRIKSTALSLGEYPALSARVSCALAKGNKQRRAESLAGLYLLSRCAEIPECARLICEDGGKPYFENSDVFFNISHSNGFTVCASGDSCLGIDVEKLRPIPDRDRLATRYFCKEEKDYIEGSADRDTSFWRIWTRKEAYIKYLGMGLAQSLCSFNTLDPKLHFSEITVDDNGARYLISVCSSACQNIDMRKEK